jgi:transposase-like protein
MTKVYQFSCPKCNNNRSFYRSGKDKDGYQKYLCRNCHPSMSQLFGKHDFKRMRYTVQIIITALSMFYFLGKNSFRNISLILRTAFNIKVSHTTISNWSTNFAPLFDDMRIRLMPLLDLNSDKWHVDETVVKIAGVKHYIWVVVDSETRFVIGFHLSPHRDSPRAVSVLNGSPDDNIHYN